jgi:hypothetical protein
MSGKKISELQELTSLENNDLLVVVDDSEANIENKTKNVKISTLMAEIDASLSTKVENATNLGSGEGIFSAKDGTDLQLKSLVAGTNVSITSDATSITINASQAEAVSDATDTTKGIIQLAGDLAGTASEPTVPGLQLKYDASNPAGYITLAEVPEDAVTSVNGQVGEVVIDTIDEARSLIADVFNNTGSPIPKMTVVYINGGQGDMPTVALAQANSEASSSKTFAVTAEPIGNMLLGKAVVSGALKGLDTTVFGAVEGTTLYLSPTVAGGITATKPVAPNHMVAIGKLVRVHQNEGVIEVTIQNGYEIDELHDVLISGVANGQVLKYDQSTSLWKNQTLTAADVGLSTVSSDLNNKANTNLSNLVTTSIPSGVDIISNSGSGVQFDVKTIGSTSGNTGVASFGSGSTTLGGSGYVEIISGTGNATSGAAYVETGKASTGTSGAVEIITGRIANDGYLINNGSNASSTGRVAIQSGSINSTASYPVGSEVKSGLVVIGSGNSNSRAGSGNATMQSGISSSSTGFSGQALVKSGDATVSGGSTGNTFVLSGSVSAGAGNSGVAEVRSGTTVDGATGNVNVSSGVSSGSGSSGFAQLKSGDTVNGSTGNALVYSGAINGVGTGNTGIAQLFSGSSVSGTTGNVTVASGNSSSGGATGNVTLQTGSTSGSRGEVIVNSPALNMNSNKITRVAEFYFGDPNVEGTYRIRPSGGSLVTERRESGVWVVKQTIT